MPDDLVMSNFTRLKTIYNLPWDSDVKSGDAKCKDSTHVENDYLHALSVKTQGTLPWKSWSDQTKNGLKFPLNSWMPTSRTCLVVSPGLNQFEPGRNDLQCVWLANAIQIEVVKIYQPSEDWQQQSQAVPHLASWCSSDTLLDSNFYWKFVKLAVGSIPVCVFDKSIGLLVNIPFCSWRKQPNPWRHPGTPLPEILGGLALVRLGFTPKMLGNQSHSPSVNVMAWYGTIRIHTKLTSKFLVSSTILLAYEPQSKFIVCVKSVIKLVSPLSFYRLSCFYILWQLFTSV